MRRTRFHMPMLLHAKNGVRVAKEENYDES